MEEKKSKKKVFILVTIGVLIISLLFISVGYAFYQIENTEGESVTKGTINLECLKIEYPIKDEYALEYVNPIKVKITNTCETNLEDINYSLVLTT